MDTNVVKYVAYSLDGVEYGVRPVGIHLGQIPAAWSIRLNSEWHKKNRNISKPQKRSEEGIRYDIMYHAKPQDGYARAIQNG